MGRITYYDPIIWGAKQLAKGIGKMSQKAKDLFQYEQLQMVNAIETAPYIRSATLTGNYRFTDTLEFKATGFWGMDGIGVKYETITHESELDSETVMHFIWTNYQGFLSSGLSWNPRNDMLLKLTMGAGYEQMKMDGDIQYNIANKYFSPAFADSDLFDFLQSMGKLSNPYKFDNAMTAEQDGLIVNAQGRLDYDWDLGKGFLLAAGAQEMLMRYKTRGKQMMTAAKWLSDYKPEEQETLFAEMGITDPAMQEMLRPYMLIAGSMKYNPNAENNLFTTSGYGLTEYHTPGSRFKTELGMRVDHYYLKGEGLTIQSKPALNPRINLDFNIFKNKGFVQSLDLSAGTGLFSSMNNNVLMAEEQYNIDEIKPNRSLTSVLGTKLEIFDGVIVNIEGYYKYNYDRMYIPISAGIEDLDIQPQFNGEGKVWGLDLMLQKKQARYWDGWIAYSYNWTKYHDPDAGNADMGMSGGGSGEDWYYPDYHRFHNLNMVLNIKPIQTINIYTRLGLASGVQIPRRTGDGPVSYPVYDIPTQQFIELFYWPNVIDENNRTTPSIPLDVKLSIFGNARKGKVLYEVYVAVENVLGLLSAKGNTSYNTYTGEEDTGSMSASYEIPIPIPSFGFKISY